MESANLHHQHHQLQDQLALASSSLVNPSCYGVAASSHSWTPTVSLTSTDNFSPSFNGAILNSRQTSNSMIQDLGLQWTTNAVAGSFTTQPADDLQLAKIKQELSGSFPKFTEMLTSSSSSCIEDTHLTTSSYLKNDHKNLDELSQKLLLKTISSGFPINNGHQFSAGEFLSESHNCTSGFGRAVPGRSGSFSQIYPSINISNLNQSSSSISSSFDMNLQALEGRFSGHVNQSSRNLFDTVYKDSLPFGLGHFQQSSSCRPSCSPSRISSFANETAEAKRSSSLVEPKAATDQAAPPKKSRLDSRAPCPPFKVRKEKLGDRIAALQQLVAPFGKTDTASVLMEAIGYIKFLQSQVETLSVPYMKSSRNKIGRTTQGGSGAEDGKEEPKRDLRSRGLCLVPLSCMSYVTGDAGGGIWPPHCFGDGT